MKAEIFRYTNWLSEISPDFLRTTLQKALEQAKFKIIGHQEHFFTPQGYTCLWLLGESHLAVHTFPEEGVTYIELSSCNKVKHLQFIEIVERECRIIQHVDIKKEQPIIKESRHTELDKN